jgi:hypothetical protein
MTQQSFRGLPPPWPGRGRTPARPGGFRRHPYAAALGARGVRRLLDDDRTHRPPCGGAAHDHRARRPR